eukprot:TRINITY_DN405_c0_g1_i3.p1 TRINITY_DN405_c0_g1~~TRINITY_DN405_c0_g1_i3.p1  ORF type:complete len:479 (-),score=101.48 TRINITY_DN405_c0_g1_i3:179-1615(-)
MHPRKKVRSEVKERDPIDAKSIRLDGDLLLKENAVFKCSICLQLLEEPKSLACGHCFCDECLKGWISKKASHECPTCRGAFDESKVFPASTISLLIQGSEIHCPNYRQGKGCASIFVIGKDKSGLAKHLAECVFHEVSCGSCGKRMERRLVSQHEDECPELLVECQHCSQSMAQKLMKAHCDVSDVAHVGLPCQGFQYCPNKCSDSADQKKITSILTMPDSLLKEYLDKCPNERIACSLCDAHVLRCEMDAHESSAIKQHFAAVLTHIQRSEQESAREKRELTATLVATEERLKAAEAEIADLRDSQDKNEVLSRPIVSMVTSGWQRRKVGDTVRSAPFEAFGHRFYIQVEKSQEASEEDSDTMTNTLEFGLYTSSCDINDYKISSALPTPLDVSFAWMLQKQGSNEIAHQWTDTALFDFYSGRGWAYPKTISELSELSVYSKEDDTIRVSIRINSVHVPGHLIDPETERCVSCNCPP